MTISELGQDMTADWELVAETRYTPDLGVKVWPSMAHRVMATRHCTCYTSPGPCWSCVAETQTQRLLDSVRETRQRLQHNEEEGWHVSHPDQEPVAHWCPCGEPLPHGRNRCNACIGRAVASVRQDG